MKRCGGCGESKPLDQFNRDKRRGDGRQSPCKACRRAHRQANREAIAAQERAYYANNREVIAKRQREYWQANREAIAAQRRADADAIAEQRRTYRAANRQAIAEQKRIYNQANPHVYWESDYRRRVRRFGFEPVVESFTRADLLARYGDACWHCGGEFEQLDHYPVPVSRGGPHALDNCRPSCTPCNKRTWKTDVA